MLAPPKRDKPKEGSPYTTPYGGALGIFERFLGFDRPPPANYSNVGTRPGYPSSGGVSGGGGVIPARPPPSFAPSLPDVPPPVVHPPVVEAPPDPQPRPAVPEPEPVGSVPGTQLPDEPSGEDLATVTILGTPLPKPSPFAPGRRRRAPPKKPVRPRRTPVRRTAPNRIPIRVPPLLTRFGGLLGLAATALPLMFEYGVKLDDAATFSWQNRLGLLPDDHRRPTPARSPSPNPVPAGSVVPADDVETVVVTAHRPRTSPAARPRGNPLTLGAPALLPVGVEWFGNPVSGGSFPSPSSRVKPQPKPGGLNVPLFPSVSPSPVNEPLASPFNLPAPASRPAPAPRPSPRPSPSTPTVGAPSIGSPTSPIVGTITPVPDLGPVPVQEPDRCRCPRPKKEKKKRKERSVCSSGSYTQTATGLRKQPKKYFDCASGREVPAPKRGSTPIARVPDLTNIPGWPTGLPKFPKRKRSAPAN